MPNRTVRSISMVLPDSEISYYPQFLAPEVARELYYRLIHEVAWQQDPITLFGKTYMQPRLTALYGLEGKPYSYSGIIMEPRPFLPGLLGLKQKVEELTGATFTTCLLNLYRNGNDSNGWHADNEQELGRNPIIASVSLGATRVFHLKHRKKKEWKHKMHLEHGSLLLMGGTTQHHWLHQVPKTKKPCGERINITFRKIH